MYEVTIQCDDRVVTSGRVNVNKESIAGLDEGQIAEVIAGKTVYIPSRRRPTAVVEIEISGQKWRHVGGRDTLPDLAAMESGIEIHEALKLWADSSRITAVR